MTPTIHELASTASTTWIGTHRYPNLLDCMCALASLTPQQREAWIDHHLIGLTYAQIAKRDNATPHAILLRVHTARARLAATSTWLLDAA